MMKKFELCYDIEPDKSFLVPDLLPKDEPFTGDWSDSLAFHYHYYILPTSIISRFIVRMNAFIHGTIWRSGVVLMKNGNIALVKADTEDRIIYIRVTGDRNTRRDFLSMIRGELETIHKTIAKIEVAEKVPIPNNPNAEPVDYKLLLQLEQKGIATHHVKAGNKLVETNVRALLNGIEPEKVRAEKGSALYIGGDVRDSTITLGDDIKITLNKNVFKSIYRLVEESSREETDKEDIIADVNEIEYEVAKGEQVNESFLSRRLRNLKKTAPDIADVVLAALTGPGAALAQLPRRWRKGYKVKQNNIRIIDIFPPK